MGSFTLVVWMKIRGFKVQPINKNEYHANLFSSTFDFDVGITRKKNSSRDRECEIIKVAEKDKSKQLTLRLLYIARAAEFFD